MKVIRFHEYGGPEVLRYEDTPLPVPEPGQVLIEVTAAGVNFADTMRRAGTYLEPTPLPYILGYEAAGTVKAVGAGVTSVSVGASVVAILTEGGGYAQYAVAASDQVVALPPGLEAAQATALIVQGMTAYLLLKDAASIQPGQSVLVHAAAGGVGTLAIQIAQLLGAGRIIATASTEDKLTLARSLGADAGVNYTQEDWPQQVMTANGGQGVDIVLEMVGGAIFARSFDALAPFGHLIAYGAAGGQMPVLEAGRLLAPNQTVSGFYLGGYFARSGAIPEALTALFTYVMQGRQTTGKVVLAPWK